MVGKSERLRVAVLMGGPSSEHDVSLQGGKNVVDRIGAAGDPVGQDRKTVGQSHRRIRRRYGEHPALTRHGIGLRS